MQTDQAKLPVFRISKLESVEENVRRILYGQIDYILAQCEDGQTEIHKSIHEIRKSIKRIRAVLRLVRDEIGYSSYFRENEFFRDINRSTSELREYNVLLLSLEGIVKGFSGKINSKDLDPLIHMIQARRDEMLERISDDENTLRELGRQVRQVRKRIEELPIEHKGFEVFYPGLNRIYRKGRYFLKAAKKDADTELLHDMRKRVKYLWYHMDMLRPVYPGPMKAYAVSLEKIAEKLGDYHDFAVLEEYLMAAEKDIPESLRQTLVDACVFRKSALLPGIYRMSEAAYTEKPAAFMNRMENYWNIAHGTAL